MASRCRWPPDTLVPPWAILISPRRLACWRSGRDWAASRNRAEYGIADSFESCHYERSEESAFASTGTTVRSKQQIPRGLNFAPTSAKTALVGDPCSPARDDKVKGLQWRTDRKRV